MEAYLLDWANLLLRWLHFIAGVAWIGASFYFVMLDNSLRSRRVSRTIERGVGGELWAVHGGGVYQSQKYLLGPVGEPLAEKLHWSKWEAYTTWLSGMGLLAVIYWLGAGTYLIDQQVMACRRLTAVLISIGVLPAAGSFTTDCARRCEGAGHAAGGDHIHFDITLSSWGLFQLFSARGAYLHVGAMMGTIMAANVFFCIIPGQKRVVARYAPVKRPMPSPVSSASSVRCITPTSPCRCCSS